MTEGLRARATQVFGIGAGHTGGVTSGETMNTRKKDAAVTTISMADFSPRFRFSDWRNNRVPPIAAGSYVVWDGARLIYCGMSGRDFHPDKAGRRRTYGLHTRLASHASGRLSGDQFCVYVANRLVMPTLMLSDLPKFGSGETSLDERVKQFIHARLEYQYVCVSNGNEARALENRCRRGEVFGAMPDFNPLQARPPGSRRPLPDSDQLTTRVDSL